MVLVKQVVLKEHVTAGYPDVDKHFAIAELDIPEDPKLEPNHIYAQILYIPMDPYIRGRMSGRTDSYVPPIGVNTPLVGFGVAKVLKSNSSALKEGDLFHGYLPWADRCVIPVPPSLPHWPFLKADPALAPELYVGALGMTGMTAYMGLMKICRPKKGETLYVSAGCGAVGQMVAQLGKRMGLYVVGSAGSDEKVNIMKERFGYDDAFNYKTCGSLIDTLKATCPKGIDCYFDNVGGDMLDCVMAVCNRFCRIAACGAISAYNISSKDEIHGLKNSANIVMKSITIRGFIVSDLIAEFGLQDALDDITAGLQDGSIKPLYDIVKAHLNEAPACFIRMLRGDNVGKQILEVIHQ
eukprot:Blabericola_migrator_1__2993@NODE_1867_length_3627_cov_346_757865_g1195_i0_p2_GENE_NODE_1867_length_3627_cov_346_757865_g1195_i0NODE_1867_length_3627_cov_346_757865_g1195_i0_p2_ORF_typecomplete_len353_score82_03ADH_N_2/PF16884_5/5_3e24ADH_zinc_N/PF00107_26/1_3e20ADH_zinc_N_2/PF13602_6/5_3e08DUF2855/PF11017_8/0_0014ELFV_dehydrog/PF00208_21/0_18_NODE_1867_length_3627_cov_346_757865_g1195_i0761134